MLIWPARSLLVLTGSTLTPTRSCSGGENVGVSGVHGLFEQHGDGHGADPAGDRCYVPSPARGLVEVDVTDVAVVVPGVYYHGARSEPLSSDEPGPAHGGDDDVGAGDDIGQPPGVGVAVGDRSVASQQQHADWFAEDGAAPDDHCVAAGELYGVGV